MHYRRRKRQQSHPDANHSKDRLARYAHLGNRVMNAMGVTNHFLITLKASSVKWNLGLLP